MLLVHCNPGVACGPGKQAGASITIGALEVRIIFGRYYVHSERALCRALRREAVLMACSVRRFGAPARHAVQ